MIQISIIIPAYNAQENLSVCLDSLVKQSYQNFEIIIVDNNSNDHTKKVIEKYSKKDPRIRYVYESKRSRGAARNAGIKASVGEIISMIDSDCVAPNDWLDTLVNPIIDDGEDIVMGWEEDLIKTKCSTYIQQQNKDFLDHYILDDYITTLDTKNCAFKASILKEYMFDENIGNLEDFELALRLRTHHRIRFLEGVKVQHHHKSSAWGWMQLQCNRGYWAKKIYKKHSSSEVVRNELMFQSMKIKNFIQFPFWMVYQFMKEPSRRIWYTFVSELGWRVGLLVGR